MMTLGILASVFAALIAAGRFGARRFTDPVIALRFALAAMFLFTGLSHFGPPRADLVRMVPPGFPTPGLLVTLTGIAELAGAVGLLLPRFARSAGYCLALLLVAMFPANVYAAREQLSVAGTQVLGVWPRGLMQLVFIAAALLAARRPRMLSKHEASASSAG